MELTLTETGRGFSVVKFKDANGISCTLQESSAIDEEGKIWFGCSSENPVFVLSKGQGWVPMDMPPKTDYLVHDRMHLTQTQVQYLLPLSHYFVEHGHLPSIQDS